MFPVFHNLVKTEVGEFESRSKKTRDAFEGFYLENSPKRC